MSLLEFLFLADTCATEGLLTQMHRGNIVTASSLLHLNHVKNGTIFSVFHFINSMNRTRVLILVY